ncbi:MAG: TauD/TfdA family dioxygenase, partial [Acidobacteriota bacterium]|nr:TauD/TfdA family dioxygenase [Acidobacteriota bacterium]
MKMSFINDRKLPLLVEPSAGGAQNKNLESLVSASVENKKFLREKLLEHGALLFRGFAVENAADFERFARAFSGKRLLDYAGGVSPRV